MSPIRNLMLITLIVFSGILLSLNSPAVSSASPAFDTQATFTVTNADDGGTGSLRNALGLANISGGADTIVFDSAFFNTPRTINLSSALPGINEGLTITGPGAHLVNIRRATGGNYRIFTISSGVTATISGLTISNGNAGTGDGGGILNDGTLTIANCHITGNTAVGGGGISNTLGNLLTLTQSTVSGNTATGSSTGGGIASFGGTTIANSTISGNIVTGSNGGNGGGLRLSSAGATITSSTITNNSAAGANSAGGLRDNLAPVNIRNSILAGNVSNTTVPDVSFAGGGDLQSGGYNLIGNRGTLTFSGTNDQSGTAATPLNPQLASLRIFGGTTPVHALSLTSPAFDKGAVDSPIATDQRGFNRRADIPSIPNAPNTGDASDIGAVEMQTVFVTNTNDSGTGSLRQLILGAPAGSDIMFDPTVFNVVRTITLTSGEMAFSKNLTVSGPGANLLTVSGNNASRVFSISGSGLNVAISGLTISNGKGGAGGGVIVANSIGTFADCAFTNNTAVGNEGGAVQLANAGGTFTGCTFSGNTAGGNRGGAVSVENSSGTFTNCTVSGNTATFGAGIALFNTSGNRTLSITNCTIVNNTSQSNNVSGLLVEVATGLTTTATLRNSIIANNSGINNLGGIISSQGFNLTSDNSTTFLNQATDITNVNPQLGALQNNGGATPTHALLPNSPAIDKGSAIPGLTVDQRERTRPFDVVGVAAANGGDNSDIGAVETQVSIVRNDEIVAVPGSLRQVIADAPAGADILFDPAFFNVPRSIFVSGGEILINKNLTIIGPGANLLTLSGSNLNRVFAITAGNTVTLSGLTISNGKATADGGGIVSAGNLTMTNCNIVNNTSGNSFGGGGISVLGATATFTECNFSGNKQNAVLLTSSSGTITNCAFTGNTTLFNGGAINLISSSTVAITGCTMNGNTASGNRGGAVSVENSSGSFTNCTISGNQANFGAGIAMFNTSGNRTLAVTNCTITGNTSVGNNASGLLVEVAAGLTTTATIRNSIIANNSGTENVRGLLGGVSSPATLISQGFNLTSDNSTTFLNQATDITNANPLLAPLANNGGATQTHALLPGSPAVDKGLSSGVLTDQRGIPRPIDDAVVNNATGGDGADIGAFERTSPVVVSAASFKRGTQAQESIVAMFGEFLTNNIAVGNSVPLPTTLDSTSLTVLDAQNQSREAPLFFVSPGQINFLIPTGTAVGDVSIFVRRNGVPIASTKLPIAAVEPSLFTANASGTGIPAAVLFRVRNGVVTNEAVTSAAIDIGPEGDVLVLVLYGGGIRKRSNLSTVTMKIGGVTIGADYAGEAPGFIGLDQINTVVLPRSLAGKGLVNLELSVDGKPANVVQLNFK
ncbi:MAG: choice-of-anchor Q domain-containing protein [Acidobacteriota bacterium]|nr:choice-of-anchor Q domain-containing protein [Acidobacteriota bacterium]